MNTSTQITTAARRIVRKVNATPDALIVHFDTNGDVVDVHEADMHYLPGQRPAGIAASFVGCKHDRGLTQREAQDVLDAYSLHPDSEVDRREHLYMLDFDRRMEAAGRTGIFR